MDDIIQNLFLLKGVCIFFLIKFFFIELFHTGVPPNSFCCSSLNHTKNHLENTMITKKTEIFLMMLSMIVYSVAVYGTGSKKKERNKLCYKCHTREIKVELRTGLQAGNCQIFRLAESPSWRRVNKTTFKIWLKLNK